MILPTCPICKASVMDVKLHRVVTHPANGHYRRRNWRRPHLPVRAFFMEQPYMYGYNKALFGERGTWLLRLPNGAEMPLTNEAFLSVYEPASFAGS